MSNIDFLVLTLLHLAIWVFLYRIKHTHTDVFDPFYLVTGLYFLIFVFAPCIWILNGQRFYQGLDILEFLPQGTIAFNLGYFAYALASFSNIRFGTFLKSSQFEAKYGDEYVAYLESPKSRKYITRYAWTVYIISMFLSLLFYRMRGRSLLFMLTFGQGAELLPGVEGIGLYFLMYFIRSAIPSLLLLIAFSDTKRKFVFICAYITASVCMSSGSRNLAICVVLSILVYYYLNKGIRPRMITVALGVVFLYLFVTLMGLFRESIKIGEDIQTSQVDLESMFNAFMYNVNIFYPFYSLVGLTQKGIITSHYGLGILNIFIQFIPRIIWPGKPETIGQTALVAMYGDNRGGAAYPNIGEFYYETGVIGMVIFMFIFGYIVREAFVRSVKSKNRIVMIMYAILYGAMMQLVCRGHFASWSFELVFMWGPLFWLNSHMKRRFVKSLSR